MAFDEEEDLVVYETPIEREEDTSARKRRAVADAGQLRALPAWKQEVRDEEGRRRFHGAFTGGFSAGFYNTVGSKEGWTPQTFTSSRKNRAEVKKQSIYSFLDEEDIKGAIMAVGASRPTVVADKDGFFSIKNEMLSVTDQHKYSWELHHATWEKSKVNKQWTMSSRFHL